MTHSSNGTAKDRFLLETDLPAPDARAEAGRQLGILETRTHGDFAICVADVPLAETQAAEQVIRRDIDRLVQRHLSEAEDAEHLPASPEIVLWPVSSSKDMPFQALGWVSAPSRMQVLGAQSAGYLGMLMACRNIVIVLARQARRSGDGEAHGFQTLLSAATDGVDLPATRPVMVISPTDACSGFIL